MLARLALLFGLLLLPLQAADYAGQYILSLGTRIFLAINLTQSRGLISGTISLPHEFIFDSSAKAFSHISTATSTEEITEVSVLEGHLQLTTQNPKDRTDTTIYDFKLLPSDAASVKINTRKIGPWILTRVPAQPTLSVATDWDPAQTYHLDETQ